MTNSCDLQGHAPVYMMDVLSSNLTPGRGLQGLQLDGVVCPALRAGHCGHAALRLLLPRTLLHMLALHLHLLLLLLLSNLR